MVRAFLSEKGKKIICGGTTSQIVSRIAKKKPVGGATGFNEKAARWGHRSGKIADERMYAGSLLRRESIQSGVP